MFDIGWSEMAVILLVALIVIGPKDLPRVARTVGRWAGKGRAMAREFQTALEDMAREAELDKVKSEIEKAGRTIEKAGRTDVAKSIEKTIDPSGELSKALDPAKIAGKPNGGGALPSATASPAAAPPSAPAAASPAPAASAPEPAKPQQAPEPAAAKPAPARARSRSKPAGSSRDGEPPQAKPASRRKERARPTAPAEPS
jgi:sec-independent protein translocase protein TatB